MTLVIFDTVEEKYLDYVGATDVKVWVDDVASAHQFALADAQVVLDELNIGDSERFVGRPGDRGGHA